VLLSCGIAYGVVYVISNDLVAATIYDGYSRMDQAVSELSATSAPSQAFLRAMLPVYTALMVGFGVGVWQSAAGKRSVKVLGELLVAFGLTGVMWLPFPMSSRSEIVAGTTQANDVGHLVLSTVTVVLILATVGLGMAAVRRRWFRVYSWVTIVVVLAAGAGTGALSPRIAEGEPTPWLGFYERASFGAWLLWLAMLSLLLLREGDEAVR